MALVLYKANTDIQILMSDRHYGGSSPLLMTHFAESQFHAPAWYFSREL